MGAFRRYAASRHLHRPAYAFIDAGTTESPIEANLLPRAKWEELAFYPLFKDEADRGA